MMTNTVRYVAYMNVDNSFVLCVKTCTTMMDVRVITTVSPHDLAAWKSFEGDANRVADEWNKSFRLAVDVARSFILNARA